MTALRQEATSLLHKDSASVGVGSHSNQPALAWTTAWKRASWPELIARSI